MRFILFLKSLFAETSFKAGERVNHIRRGAVQRTDGYVVGRTSAGILVEWPRGGSSILPPSELALIG